jgi:hypothetical protein
MKNLFGIFYATVILLTLLSQNLHGQVQLIPTKSDFGGGYNISCYGGSNGSISVAVVGADSLSLVLYKGASQEDSTFVNSLPKVWNGLGAGGYKIYGYINDSLVAEDSLVLFQPQALALANHQAINQSCNPGGDGSIEAEISGGVLPYHFSWTGRSDTVAFIDSLNAGSYGFTVTDGNGCQFSSSVNVGTANAPQITLHVSELNQWGYHVNCAEDETANVWVSFGENASNLDINWDITKKVTSLEKGEFSIDTILNTSHVFIANLDSLNDVGAGLYRVTITNASGCSVTDSIEVLAPIVFFSEHKAACNSNWYPGSQEWGMKFWENLYGGITPYHAYGTGSSLQDTLYVYSGTTYYLDVHDVAGCRSGSISGPFQIGETTLAGMLQSMCNLSFGSHVPVQLVLTKQDYEGGANVSCYGAEDGSISTAVIGADTLTIVLKRNGVVIDSSLVNSFPKVWSGLGAGNYKVFAFRGTIPVTADSIKLFNPQLLHLKSSTLVKESCSPGGDGSIFIDISGGVQPYSYQWIGRSDTTATIDSLEAGSYSYSITDANGCVSSSSLSLGNTGIPTISVQSTPTNQWGYHLACWDDETANVWATVSGSGNHQVNWRVKEIEGTINDDFFGLVDSSISTNTYFVSGMDTLTGVTSGWYVATVGNGSGCTVKDSIEIKAPYKLSSQLKINCNPAYSLGCNCYAIELDIKPVGGIPPYTLLGHSNVTEDSLLIFADQAHYLTLRDAAGCKAGSEEEDSVEINLNDETIHGICGLDMSGQLTLVAGNKSVYPGGYNVSNHGASDGEIELLHFAGCIDDHQLYLKKLPNGNLDSLTNSHVTGLSAGNYQAYVYSCGGTMVDSITFELTQPQELSSAIGVSYSNNCNGSVNATLFAQVGGGVAGYSYQWTQSIEGGLPTEIGEGYNMLNITSFGTYFLRAIDANGDTTQAQIEITPAAQMSIQANAVAKYGEYHTRCDVGDGEIEVQLTGGIPPYALHINGNIDMGGYFNGFSRDTTVDDTSFTLHGYSAGNVGITVQDAGGCSASLSQNINLNKPRTPQVFVTGEVKPNGYYFSCDTCTDANMSVTLGDINEPVTYKWYELPSEYASSIKLDGASLIQVDQEGEIFTGEGLTPYFTGLNNTQIIPGVLNKFVAIDALGCVTSSNVILEKPKPFTQGWALDGNTGLDTTAYIGTRDSVDLNLGSNSKVLMKITKEGEIELPSLDSILNDSTKNYYSVVMLDQHGKLKKGKIPKGGLEEGDILNPPEYGCEKIEGWGKPTETSGYDFNEDGSFSVYNNYNPLENPKDIVKCPIEGNVGIGLYTPKHKLSVTGNSFFTQNMGIGGYGYNSMLNVAIPLSVNSNYDNVVRFGGLHSLFVLKNNTGNVGIGTNLPASLLHIKGINGNSNPTLILEPQTFNGANNFAKIILGDYQHYFKVEWGKGMLIYDFDKVTFQSPKYIFGNGTSGNSRTQSDFPNALMYVDGHFVAQRVSVSVHNWSDYVFDAGYKLKDLEYVKNYIEKYHHLPEIPSESEIKKSGMDVAEMNALLLKKIEELTLYVILLEGKINTIKSQK